MTFNDIDFDLDRLTDEYEAWQEQQGLSLGSADEHLFDENLTAAQRQWLSDFCRRWEGASPVLFDGNFIRHRDMEG